MALICLSPVMAMRDFSPSNELRYLSIADEALREGHIFAFTNHGVAYADKPPLYLWIIMLCRLIFGGHCMYVLSLFSFIPACVIVWAMDRWIYGSRGNALPDAPCRQINQERASMALMLCSTGLFLGMSVFLRMDMLMVMFIVLALWSWHRDRPWLFALYTFLALFTKGPVGFLMPPLAVLTYSMSCRIASRRRGELFEADHHSSIGRWLGWRFWTLMAGLCALWFAGVYFDGGKEYLDNLLFHQTVGRAVNSFHHDRPLWYYLINIWTVLAPWCLLAVPGAVRSLLWRGGTALPAGRAFSDGAAPLVPGVDVGETAAVSEAGAACVDAGRTEKMFRCAVFATFVMLSCFSAKLAIYLAPIFPFIIYLVPLTARRLGWRRWMSWAVAVPAAVVALIALVLALVVPLWGLIPALEPFAFARSPLLALAGLMLAAGCVLTVVKAWRSRDVTCAWPLAVGLFAAVLLVSPLIPQANDYVGYGNLCRDIPAGETVYVRKVHRPENMDVYLGRDVVKVAADDPVPSDGVLVSKAGFDDPALSGRTKIVHGEYAVWLPQK